MVYKILEFSRKNSRYEYLIEREGEGDWNLQDITPLMDKVSKGSRNYFFENLEIRDRRSPYHKASLELISTLSPKHKRLIVNDWLIGKQMIEKFVNSIQVD